MKENLLLLKDSLELSKKGMYRHITGVSKNFYFDVLNDIVDKYNNTFHRTTKMKPVDVKPDSYAEYSVDSNEKVPKFNIGNHVIISKDKNFKIQKSFC